MNSDLTRVGIAIVCHDDRFLIGKRPAEATLAGMHEFPGGKCQTDESPRDCAVRECREETSLLVTPIEELDRSTHVYPHGTVELHFWRCVPEDSASVLTDHNGFAWIPAEQIAKLNFPPANAAVIERLLA